MHEVNIDFLVKYVMERAKERYSDDFPIQKIEEWIREYFPYAEKMRIESLLKECEEFGHMWTWMPMNQRACFRWSMVDKKLPCKACERQTYANENPTHLMMMNAIAHTCGE